jgi:polyphenol oxidase
MTSALPDALTDDLPYPHWVTSTLLAPYPVTCVFTGKHVSYGGPGVSVEQHWMQRRVLCQQLGLDGTKLRMPGQVHGCAIADLEQSDWSDTDAVLVDQPHKPVACQYADCVPVVLYAAKVHAGAVVHAGWRGTAQRIAALTAETMMARFNVLPTDLLAVIGPAIGGCCFEVGPEVVEALGSSLSPHAQSAVQPRLPEQCLTGIGPNGNPKVDVKQVNFIQLQALGLTQIELMPDCTHCNPDNFWSYRRGEVGRQLALLCLN